MRAIWTLSSLCRLGDCFLILRNPAYPIEYATTTWWQSILERGMNAIWGRRNSAEPRRVYHEETKWPPSKFLSRLSEKEACTRQIPGMVCEAKEYLPSKEWDSIDGDKRRQACWRFHYRFTDLYCLSEHWGSGTLMNSRSQEEHDRRLVAVLNEELAGRTKPLSKNHWCWERLQQSEQKVFTEVEEDFSKSPITALFGQETAAVSADTSPYSWVIAYFLSSFEFSLVPSSLSRRGLVTRPCSSLGTRPSKNWKGGSGTSAGVEVYTAPGMKAHFRLAFD